jgi:hypothetical protein
MPWSLLACNLYAAVFFFKNFQRKFYRPCGVHRIYLISYRRPILVQYDSCIGQTERNNGKYCGEQHIVFGTTQFFNNNDNHSCLYVCFSS